MVKLLRWDVFFLLVCVAIFTLWPSLDVTVANWFYADGFHLKTQPVIYFIYKAFTYLGKLLPLSFVIAIGYLYLRHRATSWQWRKKLSFLFLVMLIGPGIIANTILKDNSVGRPRPVHIQEFGGPMQYVPVFTYSGECQKNCSFVSGHGAMGFYFIVLAWVFKRRGMFTLGMTVGVIVGGIRILQGGHFLSDVVFSFWVVYGTILMLAPLFNYRFTPTIANTIFKRKAEG